MKIVQLIQGTPEWHAHRAQHFNASDAPAMLGCSQYKTRSELLRETATGISAEIDDATQARFDRGHRAEALARPLAEKIIGQDLYPCVGVADDSPHSASFDGLTLMEDEAFEHKALNDVLRAAMFEGCTGADLPKQYRVQMEQQLLVSGGDRVLFMASKWNSVDDLVDERHCWYYPDQELRAEILAGWEQFAADVAAYRSEPAAALAPEGRAPDQLPALSIQVTGMVTASNLADFKTNALAVLGSINRDLQTDEDFANAKQTVKWCKGVEERLEATKQQVLGQTADIDAVFRTMDEVSAETRRVRLEIEKLLAREEQTRRADIVNAGVMEVREHYVTINTTMGEHALGVPASLATEIGAAIKGKKSLSSISDAVDSSVASAKIAASQQAERVRACIAVLLEQASGHESLFPDRVALCSSKTPEDLRNLIAARIAEHCTAQAKLTERAPAAAAAAACTAPAAPAALASTCSAAAAPSGARIKLGDINARIGPMSITADGLASMGFHPVGTERAAKLYSAAAFPAICAALTRVIAQASEQHAAQQQAA
ncbi:lambda-exonuclease family protein [Lysobacter sp. GCM10012299]|uniref:lambda-exonuclease family protein n=1 Tax=Lysobacter sp. GCM10012299 TaxID=3317333 RepID=UPI00360C1A84